MEKNFMTVDDVAEELSVSKSKAYKIVRQLNKELEEKGIITVAGRVCTSYFRKKVMYSGDYLLKEGDEHERLFLHGK